MKAPCIFLIAFSNLTLAADTVPDLSLEPSTPLRAEAIPEVEPTTPTPAPTPTTPAPAVANPYLKKRNTWTPEGSRLTFGSPTGELLIRGYSKDNAAACAPLVDPVCQRCWKEKLHPWLWQDQVDQTITNNTNAELMWVVNGPAQALNEELEKEGAGYASFFWTGIDLNQPKKLIISLEPNGVGMVRLYQSGQIVAQCRCVSGNREGDEAVKAQPDPKDYKVWVKATVPDKDGVKAIMSKEFKRPMKWAIGIDQTRGIYLHAGDLSQNSHGCIRVSYAAAPRLFDNVPIGTQVEVKWVKEGESAEMPPKTSVEI